MSVDKTQSEKSTSSQDRRGFDRTPRPCPVCTRSFVPKKPNQIYCGPPHRRRALRLRQRAAWVFANEQAAGQRTPAVLWRELHQERRDKGLPPIERHPYLRARARLLQAQKELERWAAELRQREQLLKALPVPNIIARYVPVVPGQPVETVPDARYCEIVGVGGGLTIVAFGSDS
jgi:hypothetical protein